MRSYNRTLIQSLVTDKDRQQPRHDLACQFLAQQTVLREILEIPDLEVTKLECERELTKWSDAGGRTVVGYIDLFMRGKYDYRLIQPKEVWDIELPTFDFAEQIALILEVKIGRCQVGDIIRQLKFYNGFEESNRSEWNHSQQVIMGTLPPRPKANLCVVVDWSLKAAEADMLLREKIWPVQLGTSFEKWIRERNNATATIKQA